MKLSDIKLQEQTISNNINGDIFIGNKELTTLEGSPIEVPGYFNCKNNHLTTLVGGPNRVGGYFSCAQNRLTTLEGAPKYIEAYFDCESNQITSLKNIHKQIHSIGKFAYFAQNPITSNILGLLLIKNLINLNGNQPAFLIINKHLALDKDVLECQEEMISAGYKEFAKL